MNSWLTTISTKLSSQKHLKQFHAQLILNSLHKTSFWVSLLVTQCTRLSAPASYTNLIFNSSTCRTVYLYNCMLKYFSHLRYHRDVLMYFRRMRREEMLPDASVYPILIKSYGKIAVDLHGHVIKMGFDCDCIVRNAIMDMYAKFGQVEIAREVFDEMAERSVADWNSMISGYWRWGLEVKARELFSLMTERNVISWTCMVTGYAKMKDLEKARTFFDAMPEKSVVSWNAMLSGYAQNGFEDEALKLFNEMLNSGVNPNHTTWVTIISSCSSRGDTSLADTLAGMLYQRKVQVNSFVQTALLDMYAKCRNIEAARNMFDGLGSWRNNSAAWNVMISGYSRIGDLATARDFFDRMHKKDVVSWNSMIAGYAQNGQSLQAIELFKQMIVIGRPEPNEVTMVSVISACGHLGALEIGKWVVNLVSKMEIKLSISGYNSMISMYSKCGSMENGMRIFKEMEVKDVVSYNTIMTGLAVHGNAVEAIELMAKMQQDGIKPDQVTFIAVLTACSHAGLLKEGQKIFESISCPTVDHYACMVDLLGRVAQIDEAVRLIDRMPMEPHSGVYGSLLNSCRIHRRVDIGELAAEKLLELEPSNSGIYVLLSNIYAVAGRWNDVERIRKGMKESRVSKTAGWSMVEYDGKMHKFIAGDKSHERASDIYRLLSEQRRKMKESGYFADQSCALTDIEEEEKEEMVGVHSEKLAIYFALLVSEVGSVIRVVKNLRVCSDCHTAIKIISKLEGREIIVRDNNRFHIFKDGLCSCKDHW